MQGFEVYRQQSAAWTRIDMLLAAYDGTITRLEQALELIASEKVEKAQTLVVRAQRIVLELYAGIDVSHGEIPANMQRLYIYVLHCLNSGKAEEIESAIDVLKKIREGLREIRPKAIELERSGVVQPVDHDPQVLLQAIG